MRFLKVNPLLFFALCSCVVLYFAQCGKFADAPIELGRPDLMELENLDGFDREPAGEAPFDRDVEEALYREDFSNGIFTTSLGTNSVARSALTFADGRILVAGRADSGATGTPKNDFALVRYNPDGSLDTSFATTGIQITDFGQGRGEVIHAAATDSQGKIIAVGRYNFGTSPYNYFIFAVARYNTNGTLDSTFGSSGMVTTNINSLNAIARAVAIQNDDKILVAGYDSRFLDTAAGWPAPHKNYDMVVARYTTAGALDVTFNSTGIMVSSLVASYGHDGAFALALDPLGKPILGGLSYINSLNYHALIRYTTSGTLDTTFGTGGMRTTKIGSGSSLIYGLAVHTDGKLVAAGYGHNGSNYDFTVARYLTNGTIDSVGFNGTGVVFGNIQGTRDDLGRAVKIQPDNKIIVAGSYLNSFGNNDVAIMRFNTNGSIDTTTFGTDGRSLHSIGTGEEIPFDISLISGGYIVVGRTQLAANYGYFVTRHNFDGSIASSGTLDKSFGTNSNGIVINTFTFDGNLFDGALQTDGKLVAVGRGLSSLDDGFLLVRYTTNGVVDTSFASNGFVISSMGSPTSEATALAFQNDGKFIVAGHNFDVRQKMVLARYNSDGTIDTTFGTNYRGATFTSYPGGTAGAMKPLVEPGGKVIAAGFAFISDFEYALVRHLTNGALDTVYGTLGTGRVTTSLLSDEDVILSAVMQTDGRVVAVGGSYNGTNADFSVARFLTNGGLDTSFSIDGRSTNSLGTNDERALTVALQTDGKTVLGGYSSNGTVPHFALARYTTAGALDTTFTASGIFAHSIGATGQTEFVSRILIQENGKIVAVGNATAISSNMDFDPAILRFTASGVLDTTFARAGKRLYSVGVGDQQANFALLDRSGKIVIGGYTLDTSIASAARKKTGLLMRIWP